MQSDRSHLSSRCVILNTRVRRPSPAIPQRPKLTSVFAIPRPKLSKTTNDVTTANVFHSRSLHCW